MDQSSEQLIEDYIHGRLPEPQRAEIEKRMETDEDYALLVEQRRLETDTMERAAREELRSRMANWSIGANDDESEKDKLETRDDSPLRVAHRRRPVVQWLGIAAGIFLLLFAGTSFYATSNYGNGALADAYVGSRVDGSRGSAADSRVERARELMAQRQYSEAVTELEDLPGNTAAMLRAEAFYQLNDHTLALAEYDRVIATNSQLADQAIYQRALTLLAADRAAEAQIALRGIAKNPESSFSKQAAEVLEKMESGWRTLVW